MRLNNVKTVRDIAIFGSANLASSVIDLIDEYRFMVNPVILGSGRPLFSSPENGRNLTLTESRTFANGNVLLYYR
ncbi:MAG: dihydrofolate reductase family protein [Bacteroidota bacterium]